MNSTQNYLVVLHGVPAETILYGINEVLPEGVALLDRNELQMLIRTPIWCEDAVVTLFNEYGCNLHKTRAQTLMEIVDRE
jgi:hypothetical protein